MVIQQIRGPKFTQFWPPTPSGGQLLTFYILNTTLSSHDQAWTKFSASSCPRRYWMTPRRLPKLFAKLPQRLAALSWKWGHDKELEKNSPRFSTWCTHNTLTRSDLHKIFLPDYALLLLCHALRKTVKSYEVWDLIFFEIALLVEVDGNSFDLGVPSLNLS